MADRTSTVARPASRAAAVAGSDLVALVLAAILPLVVAVLVIDEPPRVDLRVSNPTDYTVTVDATDDGGSWVAVATFGPGDDRTVGEVLDHGDHWAFRFRSQGLVGGELRVERAQLGAADWYLQIPPWVGDQLRAAGAPPTPR